MAQLAQQYVPQDFIVSIMPEQPFKGAYWKVCLVCSVILLIFQDIFEAPKTKNFWKGVWKAGS